MPEPSAPVTRSVTTLGVARAAMLATVPLGRAVAPAPALGAGALLGPDPAELEPRSASAPPSRPPTSPASRATATEMPMRAPQPGPRRPDGGSVAGVVSGGYDG